jgi:hypothetical protein
MRRFARAFASFYQPNSPLGDGRVGGPHTSTCADADDRLRAREQRIPLLPLAMRHGIPESFTSTTRALNATEAGQAMAAPLTEVRQISKLAAKA